MTTPRLLLVCAARALSVLLLSLSAAHAQTVWTGGTDGTWETDGNWSTGITPNSSTEAVTFGNSSRTSVGTTSNLSVGSLTFASGADAFAINIGTYALFGLHGAGIVNDSGRTQTLNTDRSTVNFYNSASAADLALNSSYLSLVNFNDTSTAATAVINNGFALRFMNSSSAGHATILNNDASNFTMFAGNSTAGHATISNTATGGYFYFMENASAGDARITFNSNLNGVLFVGNSTAGRANITLNAGEATVYDNATFDRATVTVNSGGRVRFFGGATGGDASLTFASGSNLQIQDHVGDVSLGSLAGAGSVTLGANSLLVGSNGANTVFSGDISGSGGFGKIGTGTLVLGGNNTYTGDTTVSAGTLQFAKTSALPGPLSVASGATAAFNLGGNGEFTEAALNAIVAGTAFAAGSRFGLDVANAPGGALTYASNLTDANGGATPLHLVKVGPGTLTLAGTNTHTGGTTVQAGFLGFTSVDNLGAGSVTLDGGGLQWTTGSTTDVSPRLAALGAGGGSLDTNGNNVTLGSALTGGGALTKTGLGTLTLVGASTYSGGTVVAAGTLTLGASDVLGTGGVAVNSGATLNSAGYGFDLTRLSGTGTLTGSGTFLYDSASDATLATRLTGTGALTKDGSGTFTLSGASTYGGRTRVNAGTLTVTAGGALSGTNELLIAENGTAALHLTHGATVSTAGEGYFGQNAGSHGTLSIQGAGSAWSSTFGSLFIGYSGSATATLSDGGSVSNYWGRIGFMPGSSGAVTVTGTGSTWSNTVFLSIGYLGDGSLTVANGGSVTTALSVDIGLYGGSTGNLLVTGAGSSISASQYFLGEAGNATGTLTVTAGGRLNATAIGNDDTIVTGVASDSRGTVNLGAASNAPAAAAGILNITAIRNADGQGLLQFNTTGSALAPTYFTRDGSASGSGVRTEEISTGALTLVHTAGYTVAPGILAHAGGTTINGGTLTLTAANTYTGGTIINGGTLLALNTAGSATGNGSVTVNSGATLGGSGFIDSLTTLASGGILAPGNSPGTLTFTHGLTLNDGAILHFELGAVSDLLRISGGTLTGSTSAGGITLNLASAGGFAAATYTLFDFTGATLSGFDLGDFDFGSTPDGYSYSLAFVGDTLQLTATASAIPEPATGAALVGLTALALAGWRRRRIAASP